MGSPSNSTEQFGGPTVFTPELSAGTKNELTTPMVDWADIGSINTFVKWHPRIKILALAKPALSIRSVSLELDRSLFTSCRLPEISSPHPFASCTSMTMGVGVKDALLQKYWSATHALAIGSSHSGGGHWHSATHIDVQDAASCPHTGGHVDPHWV
jgi:hypothetical protein